MSLCDKNTMSKVTCTLRLQKPMYLQVSKSTDGDSTPNVTGSCFCGSRIMYPLHVLTPQG